MMSPGIRSLAGSLGWTIEQSRSARGEANVPAASSVSEDLDVRWHWQEQDKQVRPGHRDRPSDLRMFEMDSMIRDVLKSCQALKPACKRRTTTRTIAKARLETAGAGSPRGFHAMKHKMDATSKRLPNPPMKYQLQNHISKPAFFSNMDAQDLLWPICSRRSDCIGANSTKSTSSLSAIDALLRIDTQSLACFFGRDRLPVQVSELGDVFLASLWINASIFRVLDVQAENNTAILATTYFIRKLEIRRT